MRACYLSRSVGEVFGQTQFQRGGHSSGVYPRVGHGCSPAFIKAPATLWNDRSHVFLLGGFVCSEYTYILTKVMGCLGEGSSVALCLKFEL